MVFTQAKQGCSEVNNNKDIKQSHCRGCGCGSHSGIFHARSYQIGKTLFGKRRVRGRSPITTFGDDNLCFITATARMEDPCASSGIFPLFYN